MCTIQDRDEILSKPILTYADLVKLVGCGDTYAYRIIEDVRTWMEKRNKPLPPGKKITSAAYRQYFEIQ